MRSTRTSVITVRNNRVSCRPHLEQKLRTLLRCNRYTCALLPDWTLAIVTSCLEQLNLLTKASMITRYHCDFKASCSEVPCARWCASQRSWTPCHLQQLIWEQTNTRIERLGAHASNSAGRFMPLVYYNMWDCIFKYRRGENAHWMSKNKMAAMAVQWGLCVTNFRENMANLFHVIMGTLTGLFWCC